MDDKQRWRILVVDLSDRMVLRIIDFVPRSGMSFRKVDLCVMARWREVAGQYQYPAYDIVLEYPPAVASHALRRRFPDLRGFDEAERETVSV